jgi:hypothetical protein
VFHLDNGLVYRIYSLSSLKTIVFRIFYHKTLHPNTHPTIPTNIILFIFPSNFKPRFVKSPFASFPSHPNEVMFWALRVCRQDQVCDSWARVEELQYTYSSPSKVSFWSHLREPRRSGSMERTTQQFPSPNVAIGPAQHDFSTLLEFWLASRL